MSVRSEAIAGLLSNLHPDECADTAVAAVDRLDAAGLARAGAAWWSRLEVVAKTDPAGAGRLAAAMLAMLSAYRPESPAPLDAGFEPTESVPHEAPIGGAP